MLSASSAGENIGNAARTASVPKEGVGNMGNNQNNPAPTLFELLGAEQDENGIGTEVDPDRRRMSVTEAFLEGRSVSLLAD